MSNQYFEVYFRLKDEHRDIKQFKDALENAIDGWKQLKILGVIEVKND